MSAVFEDFEKAADLLCDDNCNCKSCDWLEMEFPMREHLVPMVIELVVKDILGAKFQPIDYKNSSADEFSQTSTAKPE